MGPRMRKFVDTPLGRIVRYIHKCPERGATKIFRSADTFTQIRFLGKIPKFSQLNADFAIGNNE